MGNPAIPCERRKLLSASASVPGRHDFADPTSNEDDRSSSSVAERYYRRTHLDSRNASAHLCHPTMFMYTVSQKSKPVSLRHIDIGLTSDNRHWPFVDVLSLAHSAVNLQYSDRCAQYTPPTPTRLNSTVESRRR